ncbi:MAG: folate-binding protein YgfZ [Cellvibrionaceae bacterium]|jgi:folate-binding protein YgfZ
MGFLRVSGASRLDLINRMSTNQVSLLKPGQGAATVLTTDISRIIDRLIIYADETTAIAMTGEQNDDNIGRYLMRFVFYNDDFSIQPITNQFTACFVYGAGSAQNLNEISGLELNLSLHSWVKATINKIELTIHATDPLEQEGFMLLFPIEDEEKVMSALVGVGSQPITDEQFDALRIEAVQPRLRYEMTGDYIPLETGLWDDVSFTKGCYTGQEIIARMDSRGKIARKLVQLDFDSENMAPLETGATITANGKPAGAITTSVGQRALGYVKSSALEKGLELMVGGIVVRPVFEPQKL